MIRVNRRACAPQSLEGGRRPFKEDLKFALHEDFHGKCYLCEGNAAASFDVEHLRPVVDFPEREFDWHNLFPAHSRCNERRKTWSQAEREPGCSRWPRGGLLDCASDDIDSRLSQRIVTRDCGISLEFAEKMKGDAAAANTALELIQLHTDTQFWGRQHRSLIEKQYRSVLRLIEQVNKLRESGDDFATHEVERAMAELRTYLAPSAPYAGLLRQKLRETMTPEFCAQLSL